MSLYVAFFNTPFQIANLIACCVTTAISAGLAPNAWVRAMIRHSAILLAVWLMLYAIREFR